MRDIAPYLALGAAALAVVLLVLVVRLMVGQRRLRRAQVAVLGVHGERDIVSHAQDLEEQVRNLRDAVEGLDDLLGHHKAELDRAFTHRAVVRYDAFRDIGGEQSASIALLDNNASGLVISMIHSRDYARIYVKQLRRSVPDRALSPEEVEVVERALVGVTVAPAQAGAAALAGPPATAQEPPRAAEPPRLHEPRAADPPRLHEPREGEPPRREEPA